MKTTLILLSIIISFNFLQAENLFEENVFEKFTTVKFTNHNGKSYTILSYNNVLISAGENEIGNEVLDDLSVNNNNTSMVYTRIDGSTYRTNNMRTWKLIESEIDNNLSNNPEENELLINDIMISPNPANSILSISFNVLQLSEVSISLINAKTQEEILIMENSSIVGQFNNNFNITSYERGNYFVLFKINGNQVAKILNKFGD